MFCGVVGGVVVGELCARVCVVCVLAPTDLDAPAILVCTRRRSHFLPQVLAREIYALLTQMFQAQGQQNQQLARLLLNADWQSSFLPDLTLYHLQVSKEVQQRMLDTFDLADRYRRAIDQIKKEIELVKLHLDVKKETSERFNEQMRKTMFASLFWSLFSSFICWFFFFFFFFFFLSNVVRITPRWNDVLPIYPWS
jgi:ATP-dependent Lon protease